MGTWPLQQARAHLREVIDGALADGPQRITRHGKQAVIVVAEDEWDREAGPRRSFGDVLAESPLSADDLPSRRPARISRGNPFE